MDDSKDYYHIAIPANVGIQGIRIVAKQLEIVFTGVTTFCEVIIF
jgi:hypothetical protein